MGAPQNVRAWAAGYTHLQGPRRGPHQCLPWCGGSRITLIDELEKRYLYSEELIVKDEEGNRKGIKSRSKSRQFALIPGALMHPQYSGGPNA